MEDYGAKNAIEGRATIPSLRERIDSRLTAIERERMDLLKAQELLGENPEVHELLNIMRRNRGIF